MWIWLWLGWTLSTGATGFSPGTLIAMALAARLVAELLEVRRMYWAMRSMAAYGPKPDPTT